MSNQWKRRPPFSTKPKVAAPSPVTPKKTGRPTVPKKDPPLILSKEYISSVCASSYLGKKGYTIPRECLTAEDFEFLHTDLFVKPQTMGPQYGGADASEQAFPVYRENAKKIYIPRFYGIARYGMPSRSEIGRGDQISVEFAKPLRDYQDKIIDVYMKHVKRPICVGASEEGSGGILEVPCGRGKCLGKDTPILMYDGSIKMVQDIVVGDLLMGDDSSPRTVLTLARGREKMWRVKYDNGSYIVNESHILSLKLRSNPRDTIDIGVKDVMHTSHKYLGYRVPIIFPEQAIEGGDTPYITGYHLIIQKREGVVKRIPLNYKINCPKIQSEVLSGMLYGLGYIYKYNVCFDVNGIGLDLANDIVFLARCLGHNAYIKNEILFLHLALDVRIICPEDYHYKDEADLDLTYLIKLEPLEEDDYYGFEIDGNRRFVLGDFTVTHNTVMALKIIALLGKKTLIIVHKEFLMNQWIERAQEFLPGAKIGRIQGSVFDIQGKDIVLGMLQTLYDRELPDGAFDSFGLTIVDEVHRIGSEQFSKTLLRTITPNMLGISATVDRKDKLTKVLYMFIGEKIYTEKREDEDPVCVRAIEYISADPEFNETEFDFRGHPKYSTMISKISDFGPRSDFIVKVLADLIVENQDGQIMVLCHNRSMLTYFYNAIQHRGFASVGYYVGGMKQVDLQETEGKQIVLATYAMAAEALDIKTLSILVMASPKTDITQSVGRILRVRHDNPIVVDIVDRHDLFQNQWKQRKTFYRKCNYRIKSIDSIRYKGMALDWTTDKTWTSVFEPKTKGFYGALTNHSAADGEELDETQCTGGNPLLQKKCLISFSDLDFDEDN